MADSNSWKAIFNYKNINSYNFDNGPYILHAEDIKRACQNFTETSQKEVRILCKQDSREDRPNVFVQKNLFLLPKKNGSYYIVKGEGYVDIPDVDGPITNYVSKLNFDLISSRVGDSEMQYLDFAYANSLIRTFMEDPSLVLTIRGRKFTPSFSFTVNGFNLDVESVQTEVDAGYEGKNSLVLVEAKNSKTTNTIIRQLYYPYRQWYENTGKIVYPLFFEKRIINGEQIFYIWQYEFTDPLDYNSIHLVKSGRYRIIKNEH